MRNMMEPVIARPRKQVATAVLISETLSSTLHVREESMGGAAGTGHISEDGGSKVGVLRADAPLSVNPSRRRCSGSMARPRLDAGTLGSPFAKSTKKTIRELIDMSGTSVKEEVVEKQDKTVIIQHSTIRKPVGIDMRGGSISAPKKINVSPKPISPIRRGWHSAGSAGKVGERTPCETTRERDSSASRSPVHRRSAGSAMSRLESNVSTPNSSKNSTVSRGAIGAFGPFSPLSSLRLTDLERPGTRSTPLNSLTKTPGSRRARPQYKIVNLALCKYPLLRIIAQENGFKIQELEDDLERNNFNIVWSDTVLPLTRLVRLANWQRTNHFPSMYLLCRKGHLGITLGRMRKVMPSHYIFYPRTWSLRSERHQFARFLMALRSKKLSKFFIMKPNSGCQGRGIMITRDPLNAVEDLDNYIVQEYITRPLLLEGRKFDLRVYVLLTSIRAPSIFLFNDGLVRQCAELYERPTDANVKNTCKHLTNYAVNKHNPEYVFNDDPANCNVGNKRNFKFFNEWLESCGKSVEQFWARVAHVICKTILVAQPQIANVYNSCFPRHNSGYSCFEVLGFDILVDNKMKPWLMEVNHTPSLVTDTPLDYEVKHALISEVWDILDVKVTDRKRDERKERDEFIQRMMRPPVNTANTHTTTAQKRQNSGDTANGVATNGSSSNANQASNATGAGSSSTQDGMTEWEKTVEGRRAAEDSRLRNFRRIYPSDNSDWQALYDMILAQARALCSGPLVPGADDRLRRVDTTSVAGSLQPSQSGGSTAERSGRGGAPEAIGEGSVQSAAGVLRLGQRQRPQEASPSYRKTRRVTGTTTPTPTPGAQVQKTPLELNQGTTVPQAPLLRPPQLPPSMELANVVVHQKERRPTLMNRVCLPDSTLAEKVVTVTTGRESDGHGRGATADLGVGLRKTHVVSARILSPVGKASPGLITTSPPESPTADRIEALRSLQKRLDQEAECEISTTQENAEREDSFHLDE
ncbi:tubulin-tyrsoine ligase-like protein, putative [Trypanosoma brucei gambiense DAL972]|uniref:Tubulin-tyrsoine ligase-like protein, putative n=1 Tax=Trypanosoma brucei gambiense (strain MHOM/CI/86/DAL972) TaxID=679716 RepID=D0A7K4_TRYB9|nr:tubulin-tyrsoine ligase-like protein, putative [Trypanosoma brucei gambiense DAL972]CBH17655.1 tubulin-tyrsoine ligase-like protein, putative [Trypanosoma brucei gambiense DAL972]|eukprot:XP_011779919.1 tubulin-tyrsoine ligase-like protein, putative [Trypanosoma brucei gambiense DAL972]